MTRHTGGCWHVDFERYEALRDYQSEDGVIGMAGSKVVFVKDSEGNTLEMAQAPTGS